MESTNPTFLKSLKGGAIAGLAGVVMEPCWTLLSHCWLAQCIFFRVRWLPGVFRGGQSELFECFVVIKSSPKHNPWIPS